MSTSLSLPLLYFLYRLINPPLPHALAYLPLIFRLLALSIAAPFLFITLLEVAGYLIVRTLGFTTRLPVSISLSSTPSASTSRTQSPVIEKLPLPAEQPIAAGVQPVPLPPSEAASSDALRAAPPPQILIPPPLSPSPSLSREGTYAYFATPGEHDFKLSGTGLFSPPDSREGSPPRLDLGSGVGDAGEGRSSALGLGMDSLRSGSVGMGVGMELRSRSPAVGGIGGLKALTPVEAR